MKELLVVCQHYDEWYREDILKISFQSVRSLYAGCLSLLGELEGDGVSDMHTVTARTSAGVKEKWNAFLVLVQY